MQQGLNPDSLLFSPFSGLRSYPLRGSHSLDDLLDRPGNSTASSDHWDGQSHSRTPSRVPSRTPSPAPTPLPSSRRSSMGSMGVASDVKVSPLLQPALNPGVGQWAGRPGNPPCHPLAGWSGPSQPSRSLPICAGTDRMGFLSPGWRVGGGGKIPLAEGSPRVLMGALEKARLWGGVSPGRWHLAQRLLESTPTAFCVFKCLTSSRRSLALQRPLGQSSALLEWGAGWGARLLLPHQTRSSLPLTAETCVLGAATPRALPSVSPRASVRGSWAQQRAVGETRWA